MCCKFWNVIQQKKTHSARKISWHQEPVRLKAKIPTAPEVGQNCHLRHSPFHNVWTASEYWCALFISKQEGNHKIPAAPWNSETLFQDLHASFRDHCPRLRSGGCLIKKQPTFPLPKDIRRERKIMFVDVIMLYHRKLVHEAAWGISYGRNMLKCIRHLQTFSCQHIRAKICMHEYLPLGNRTSSNG